MHKDSHFKVNVRRDVSLRDIFDRTVNVLRRKRYWIAVCMYMLLTILKKSGQLAQYFSNTSDSSLVNSGVAAWLGTIFQLGLLIGILGGGYVYNSVSKTKKRGLVIGLLLLSTGAGVVLTLFGVHVTSSLATLVFRCALVTIFATELA